MLRMALIASVFACGSQTAKRTSAALASRPDMRETVGETAVIGELRYLHRAVDTLDGTLVQTLGWNNVKQAEWPFFLTLFYTHTTCQLAIEAEGTRRTTLEAETRWGFDRLQTPGISGFALGTREEPAVLTEGAIFFLLERCQLVLRSDRHARARSELARRFTNAYAATPVELLRSYPNMWLPGDNAPALAALALDARMRGAAAPEAVTRFVAAVRSWAHDERTGLMCAYVDPANHRCVGPPRGSSLLLAMPALATLDPVLAQAQWQAARSHLSRTLWGLTGFREYPEGTVATADVDSGRIVSGLGESASGFGLLAAAAMADQRLHGDLNASVHAVVHYEWRGDELVADGIPAVGQAALLFGRVYREAKTL
jgi:hypothetical protein